MGLEAGTYRARGEVAYLGKSAKKGTKQVTVQCVLLDGDTPTTATIQWIGYFTEKTYERTVKTLRTFGWLGDDLADLSSIDGSTIVELVIEEEEYSGKFYSKVQWVNAIGGGSARMDGDELKAFARSMIGKVISELW